MGIAASWGDDLIALRTKQIFKKLGWSKKKLVLEKAPIINIGLGHSRQLLTLDQLHRGHC